MSKSNYIVSIIFFILGVANFFGIVNMNDYTIFSWSLGSLCFAIEPCHSENPKSSFILALLGYVCLFCFPFFKFKILDDIIECIGIDTNTMMILAIAFTLLAVAKNMDKEKKQKEQLVENNNRIKNLEERLAQILGEEE
ncbi:MAG: hypothetical protein ACRCZO_02285 [Cetobacterium sp.]